MNKRCPYCGGIKFAKIDVIGKAKNQRVQTGKDYFGKVQYKDEMVFPFSLLSYFFSTNCVEGYTDYQAFSHMHAEVCKNCGHIEFFADDNILEFIHNEDDRIAAYNDRIAAYNRAVSIAYNEVENRIKIINSIFADIEKITALSKDETITVKQQKEYLASIEEKTNEYKQAIKELDNYLKGLDSKVKKAVEPFKENIKKLTV